MTLQGHRGWIVDVTYATFFSEVLWRETWPQIEKKQAFQPKTIGNMQLCG